MALWTVQVQDLEHQLFEAKLNQYNHNGSGSDSGSEGADRFDAEPVSRFDAEDAEFGETFVNHRSVYLRSKLAAQRREQQEGYGEGVVYGEDSADFWENAENDSPYPSCSRGGTG